MLAVLAASQGETVAVDDGTVTQTRWRLMYGVNNAHVMFDAWNALWTGMLAVHNRALKMAVERSGEHIVWRISP